MRPIPQKDKEILLERKQICDRCFQLGVQWHHPFTYSGRQIVDWFATAFACPECHAEATPHNNKYKKETRKYFEHLVVIQHLEKLKKKYPKKDWDRYLC